MTSKFTQSTLTLILFLAINKLLGFAEKVLIARYFGTSDQADVFVVVQGLFITGWLFFEEILSPALIPTLQAICSPHKRIAKARLTRTIILTLVPLLVIGAVLSNAGFVGISSVLFPGFDEEKRQMARELFRLFAIGAVPFYVTPLLQAFANSEKRFFPPAFAQAVGRGAMIACFVVLEGRMGLMATGVGQIAYSVIYCLLLMALVRFPLRLIRGKERIIERYVPQVGALALPLLLGYLFSQASQWVDIRFGSELSKGTVAALSFARKLVDVPVLLLSFCIGTVLLPYLSEFFAKQDMDAFGRYVRRALSLCAGVYGIAMVGYIAFGDTIVRLVFARGKFGDESVILTSGLLRWLSPGLVVFALEIIVMQAIFASRGHWIAVLVGAGCASLNMAATVMLVPIYGAAVIPMALVGQKAIKTGILYVWLRRKLSLADGTVEAPIGVLAEGVSS